ncbi:MAG: 50S ribosomal protein L11 methyltransferase [Deltaproteobacteria bacterium]|nr:50S ribosomal protein L11 methyltransferase [Deltaproteobacteria bacterium]
MSTPTSPPPAPSSSATPAATRWQLALRGVEVAWDELSDLLAARGAEVDNDPEGEMLVATFEGEPDLIIMDALGAWLDNLGLSDAELSTRRAASDPWQPSWRAVFTATRVSERLWVRPVWEEPTPGRVDIVIDPTNAFGGGFHPTTGACLAMLDRALAGLPAGASVLDVGAGTGILAIAAAHLGASVVGVEIDGAACKAAERNAELNGVAARVTVVHDTLQRDQRPVDLVVANVLASVLIALAPAILDATGRELILSGIQTSKEEATRAAYAALELVERTVERGWVTLRLRRA